MRFTIDVVAKCSACGGLMEVRDMQPDIQGCAVFTVDNCQVCRIALEKETREGVIQKFFGRRSKALTKVSTKCGKKRGTKRVKG